MPIFHKSIWSHITYYIDYINGSVKKHIFYHVKISSVFSKPFLYMLL